MRKNKRNGFLALLLSLGMLLSLTACGDQNEPDTKNSVQETNSQEAQTENSEETLEPIKLTIGCGVAGWNLGDGTFTYDEEVLQYIYEKTGVELEFLTYDTEKYLVLLATGDLPDIMSVAKGDIQNVAENGMLLDLGELLEEYGQNILAKIPESLKATREAFGNGEHDYCVGTSVGRPTEEPTGNGGYAFRIRYDIWKEIGSPEYETEDELIDVLKQMQDYQREKTGDDTIYGLEAPNNDGSYSVTIALMSIGYNAGFLEPPINLATAEVSSGFDDPDAPAWDLLKFYYKAYKAGVLDPEYFTQDANAVATKIKDGKGLAAFIWDISLNTDVCPENAYMAALPYGPFRYIDAVYGDNKPLGADTYTVISKDCEAPERAVQLLDYLFSDEGMRLVYNGIPGRDWDYDEEGNPIYIGDMAAAYEESVDAGNEARYEVALSDNGFGLWSCGGCSDGKVVSIASAPEYFMKSQSQGSLEFAQDYGYEFPGQVYSQWIKEGKLMTNKGEAADLAIIAYSMMGSFPEDVAPIRQDVAGLFRTRSAELLTAESDEEFETIKASIIDEMLGADYKMTADNWIERYNEAKEQAKAFLE